MSTPQPDPPTTDGALTPGGVIAAVPRWLRPRAAVIVGNRVGTFLLHAGGELVRVQIFDRSMTLAAQAFTSVFPLLIMLGALFGPQSQAWLIGRLRIPATNAQLLHEALSGSRSNAFGIVGSLIVLVSATGLTRALLRSYRVCWSVRGRSGGPAAAGWQILAVLLLVTIVLSGRVLDGLADRLPGPGAAGVILTFLADGAMATVLPRILLGPVAPRAALLIAGAVFGVLMVGVRAAGSVYLPRALEASSGRYGTLGLAFTYIGWLYVLSFCLLLATVLGRALADEAAGRFVHAVN